MAEAKNGVPASAKPAPQGRESVGGSGGSVGVKVANG
jgi:hypothetical protein